MILPIYIYSGIIVQIQDIYVSKKYVLVQEQCEVGQFDIVGFWVQTKSIKSRKFLVIFLSQVGVAFSQGVPLWFCYGEKFLHSAS